MGSIERRAYIENVAAQEAAYWYCREHGIRADDLDIGQILQVAAPIILRGAVERIEMLEQQLAGAVEALHRTHAALDAEQSGTPSAHDPGESTA